MPERARFVRTPGLAINSVAREDERTVGEPYLKESFAPGFSGSLATVETTEAASIPRNGSLNDLTLREVVCSRP